MRCQRTETPPHFLSFHLCNALSVFLCSLHFDSLYMVIKRKHSLKHRMTRLLAFTVAMLVVLTVTANAAELRYITTEEASLQLLTDTSKNHIVFFYDSLDVNSLKAMEALRTFTHPTVKGTIDVIDARSAGVAWALPAMDVFSFPAIRLSDISSGKREIRKLEPFHFEPNEIGSLFHHIKTS